MRKVLVFFIGLCFFCSSEGNARVLVGSDRLYESPYAKQLKGKRIGLVTNHTAIDSQMRLTHEHLLKNEARFGYRLVALFAPEHGIRGNHHAEHLVDDEGKERGVQVYSLHGKTFRPTEEMLAGIDLLIYDIQDIGSRSYTYLATLCYVMEEAAKRKISVLVLDRPNPINGVVVDGPMLEEKWRSIVGYLNVPYCHGMTIGELAQFFNGEYKVGCDLTVVPMQGWNRRMSFGDTGLIWVPTSPHIPEATTPRYYPTTGILGELQMINIGVGYTLPFKLVGAPWVDAETFAETLNKQKFPGVHFTPFYFKPFYGSFAHSSCKGVRVVVTDPLTYLPVTTQYLIIGILKSLYPQRFHAALQKMSHRKDMFCKVNGTERVYDLLMQKGPVVWPLRSLDKEKRQEFLLVRERYLISDYSS